MMLFGGLLGTILLAAAPRSLSGTLVSIDTDARPVTLMVHAERQFQTFVVTDDALAKRETKSAGGAAGVSSAIPLPDLTPGELVHLRIDAAGRVDHIQAVAVVERARVRTARGATVELENGTKLVISSVLRFVDQDGKRSSSASVKPGQTVILFRQPHDANVYRLSAEPRPGSSRSASPPAGGKPPG
jgi:hypothetical protein